MASSAHKHLHLHLPNPFDTAATPPPTPSSQPDLLISTSDSADSLSCLLHRLPPTLTLSLPSRRSPLSKSNTAVTTVSPLISFSDPTATLYSNLSSACTQHGFFQLTDHNIPSQLAHSAESDSVSLSNLSNDEKQLHFPKNWPLGYDDGDDDDDDGESTSACKSFCLDSTCSPESTALNLSSLHEFTREMEKLGLKVIEALSSAFSFENPAREDPTRLCTLMWISEGSSSDKPGRMYPYVVGLQYQIRCQKYSLLADSGWISISPRVDSVLVTVGDIAQVWSNGKFKKVRGRALPNMVDGINSNCISMTLLVTLPLESTVFPLLPKLDDRNDNNEEEDESSYETTKEERIFNSFSFEDYAWRVYHERLSLKDPLARYQLQGSDDDF